MKFTDAGFDLLKKFEGCKLTAYQDSIGKWTIGYGHTAGAFRGLVIDQEKAEQFLNDDVAFFCELVEKVIHRNANLNQFSAAVCFAYNVRNWNHTPLFDLLFRGDFEEAKNHWLLYDKVTLDGQKVELAGLKRRREAELALFCAP